MTESNTPSRGPLDIYHLSYAYTMLHTQGFVEALLGGVSPILKLATPKNCSLRPPQCGGAVLPYTMGLNQHYSCEIE